MSSDTYLCSENKGTHGLSFEKNLAFTLFVAASMEEQTFRLAAEMTLAGKFDDAVLVLDDRKEIWFCQAKHSQDSSGEIKLNDLFPQNLVTTQPFALAMYFQSYLEVRQMVEFKDYEKRFFIFTNKALGERDKVEQFMDITVCSPEGTLAENLFAGSWEKLTPNNVTLLEKMSVELVNVRDAIITLFEKGKVLDVLVKYKTPVQSILQLSESSLRFKPTFSDSTGDASVNWMFTELCKHFSWNQEGDIQSLEGNALNEKINDPIKKLFEGKSREQRFPQMVEKKDLNEFLGRLVICSKQSEQLLSTVREKCLGILIRKYITNQDQCMFRDRTGLHKIFEDTFETWYKPSHGKDNQKDYLKSSKGNECVAMVKAKMRNNLQKIPAIDFFNYIDRTLVYDENSATGKFGEKEFISIFKEQARFNCLLVGEPGMGKTTYLKKMVDLLQSDMDNHVYFIRMNMLFTNGPPKSKDDIMEIFKPTLPESSLRFMRDSLRDHPNKCFILLDGFDEVERSHQDSAIKIIKKTFWDNDIPFFISARYNVKDALKQAFQVDALTLDPLQEDEQLQFLRTYWRVGGSHQNEDKFSKFAKNLLKKLHKSIRSEYFCFTGLPLIIRMVAEVYRDKWETFFDSPDENVNVKLRLEDEFSLLGLYEEFVSISYNIFSKKLHNMEGYASVEAKVPNRYKPDLERFDLEHQLVAIRQLKIHGISHSLNNHHSDVLLKHMQQLEEDGEKSLLINISNDNQIEFVHRSFAEYFLAKYLYENITECQSKLRTIFDSSRVVQRFFILRIEDNLVNSSVQMVAINKICGEDPHIMLKICVDGHDKFVCKFIKTHGLSCVSLETQQALHIAASCGLKETVKVLLDDHSASVDPLDFLGIETLHMAKLMISDSSDNDISLDEIGTSALHLAAEKGRLEIAKMLIAEYSAKVSSLDQKGRTPLHSAANNGQLETVKLLINIFSADVNSADKTGKTPLHLAVERGRLEMARTLIGEHSASVESLDNNARTPLHLAIKQGRSDIAKMLLTDHSANVDALDKGGRTPLHYAVREANSEIVKILINDCRANVNLLDKKGRSPLSNAAMQGEFELVKILLVVSSADINSVDKYGKTFLHMAAENGHLKMTAMLIKDYSANVDPLDKFGRTPLHYAVKKGEIETIKMLLGAASADINSADKDGKTLLHLAAERNHWKIVEMLVTDHSANVDLLDKNSSTPLHFAVKRCEFETVKMLLGVSSANINNEDKDGMTLLHFATIWGQSKIVELLITDYAANVNTLDKNGRTPLHYAVIGNKFEILKMLLGASSTNINSADAEGKTLLHLAAEKGHLKITEMLITDHSASVDSLDKNGSTPLHYAVKQNEFETVKMLLGAASADVNSADKDGDTPLHIAAEKHYSKIAKLLITDYSANVNSLNSNDRTPLHLAVEMDSFEIVKMLIDVPSVDINKADLYGNTPLDYKSTFFEDHPAIQELQKRVSRQKFGSSLSNMVEGNCTLC